MSAPTIERIQNNPKFKALVTTRRTFAWTLSAVMLAIYYAFILLIAFDRTVLGKPLGADTVITWGIPVGILVILSAFVLTGIYVKRANSEFDQLTREVVEEAQQ